MTAIEELYQCASMAVASAVEDMETNPNWWKLREAGLLLIGSMVHFTNEEEEDLCFSAEEVFSALCDFDLHPDGLSAHTAFSQKRPHSGPYSFIQY